MERFIDIRTGFPSGDLLLLKRQGLLHHLDFLLGGPFRGEVGEVGFEHPAHLEQLHLAILLREDDGGQRIDQGFHGLAGDVRPVSLAAFEETLALQGTERFPDGGSAHVENLRQFPFPGKLVSRF